MSQKLQVCSGKSLEELLTPASVRSPKLFCSFRDLTLFCQDATGTLVMVPCLPNEERPSEERHHVRWHVGLVQMGIHSFMCAFILSTHVYKPVKLSSLRKFHCLLLYLVHSIPLSYLIEW